MPLPVIDSLRSLEAEQRLLFSQIEAELDAAAHQRHGQVVATDVRRFVLDEQNAVLGRRDERHLEPI